jgi:hypothetical protein
VDSQTIIAVITVDQIKITEVTIGKNLSYGINVPIARAALAEYDKWMADFNAARGADLT